MTLIIDLTIFHFVQITTKFSFDFQIAPMTDLFQGVGLI